MLEHFKRLPGWWIASAILLAIISLIAFQQVGVLLYKTLQVTWGITLAYIADKALFENTLQVDQIDHDFFGGCRLLARALIVLGVLIAISIGL